MRRRQRTSVNLFIERLESRQLLAGINVSVFVDQNNSRSFEERTDAVAPNRLVYLDLNSNDAFDSGEPLSPTNRDGFASFEGLDVGNYRVGLLTNSAQQAQTTPVAVAPTSQVLSSDNVLSVLVSSDAQQVWTINDRGVVDNLSRSALSPSLALQGSLRSSIQVGDEAILLLDASAGQRLVRFDVKSGAIRESRIVGLAASESVIEIASVNSKVFGLVRGDSGKEIALLSFESNEVRVAADRLSTEAIRFIGANSADRLLLIGETINEAQSLTLVDVSTGYVELAELQVTELSDIALSADGQMMLVALQEDVRAYRLTDNQLLAAAILADATGPLSAPMADGRFVTGSSLNRDELIVWDSVAWQPVARSLSSSGSLQKLVTFGTEDAIASYGALGLERFDVAVARGQSVALDSTQRTVDVRIGVRPIDGNLSPVAPRPSIRRVSEDQTDAFMPTSLGVTDPDGDTLWFTVETQPVHGSLTVGRDGAWIYSPNANFVGADFATLVAHDGQSSTAFRIDWQVNDVNDPPLSISIDTTPIAEDSPYGTPVGYVSVVDVDAGAEYRLTTADTRFSIESGQIIYRAGNLDYETEPRVVFQVVAIDRNFPDIAIRGEAVVEILNVIEPPSGLRLLPAVVDEDTLGATVGEIAVIGAEPASSFAFSVSDSRFEVVGRTLKLRSDELVDYESETSVQLTITAMDVANANRTTSIVASIAVNDLNDGPLDILLSGRTVEANVAGSAVGEVTVVDADSQNYTVTASDSRFEVVDGVLKLRDNVIVSNRDISVFSISLTATDNRGASISKTFAIEVVAAGSPWQNERNPLDVNGDGNVTPLDILIVINELNARGPGPLPTWPSSGSGEGPTYRPDTSGDGYLSPFDALLIVNELNRRRGEGEAGSIFESMASPSEQTPSEIGWDSSELERLRKAKIDEELESLLDQLSSERGRG